MKYTVGFIVLYGIISYAFGLAAAMWSASVVLAYCIGVLWGAGDQIRKQEDREHKHLEATP